MKKRCGGDEGYNEDGENGNRVGEDWKFGGDRWYSGDREKGKMFEILGKREWNFKIWGGGMEGGTEISIFQTV